MTQLLNICLKKCLISSPIFTYPKEDNLF